MLEALNKMADCAWCAICKKRVKRVETFYDASRCLNVFFVYCHGQREEFHLCDKDIVSAGSIEIKPTWFFGDKLGSPRTTDEARTMAIGDGEVAGERPV